MPGFPDSLVHPRLVPPRQPFLADPNLLSGCQLAVNLPAGLSFRVSNMSRNVLSRFQNNKHLKMPRVGHLVAERKRYGCLEHDSDEEGWVRHRRKKAKKNAKKRRGVGPPLTLQPPKNGKKLFTS